MTCPKSELELSLGLSAPEPKILTAKVKATILGWRKEKWQGGGQVWEDLQRKLWRSRARGKLWERRLVMPAQS